MLHRAPKLLAEQVGQQTYQHPLCPDEWRGKAAICQNLTEDLAGILVSDW